VHIGAPVARKDESRGALRHIVLSNDDSIEEPAATGDHRVVTYDDLPDVQQIDRLQLEHVSLQHRTPKNIIYIYIFIRQTAAHN